MHMSEFEDIGIKHMGEITGNIWACNDVVNSNNMQPLFLKATSENSNVINCLTIKNSNMIVCCGV